MGDLNQLVSHYGYAAVGVVVGLESMGIPLPGETILVLSAIYAGTHSDLRIAGVIAAAALGAIVGDNVGYWLGREFGYPLLLRYGRYVGLTETRIKTEHRHAGAEVYLVRRFEDLEFDEDAFDLVVSSISLHHVKDKASLYRRIRSFMRAGGIFVFSDQLRGETESNHGVNWNRWLEFCRLPGNCTNDEIQSLLDHAAAHDHYTPLSEHTSLLHDARFAKVDCVWRNLMWGIVTAVAA